MEQQHQYNSYLSPSEDGPIYRQMNFEHNRQQHINQSASQELNKSVESASINHHHHHHNSNMHHQHHQYILPSRLSSSPSLRYPPPDEYSAAPLPSGSFLSQQQQQQQQQRQQQKQQKQSQPSLPQQDIVLYPEGPQHHHYLPMFPSPSSARPTIIRQQSDSSYFLPVSQPSVSPQDKYHSAQQESSGPTPPLTPPGQYITVKKNSSSLIVKKSDGVVVSLLNDEDDHSSVIIPSPSLNMQGVSTSQKQSMTDDTFVQRKKQSTSNTTTTGNKRKYFCFHPNCGRSFTTSGHLARHNRIHTGEKNFHCLMPGCTSKFSRQDNMMQHYRTHLSAKSRRGSKTTTHRAPILQESHSKRIRRIVNNNVSNNDNDNDNDNNNNIICNKNNALMIHTPLTTPTSTINGYNFVPDGNDNPLSSVSMISEQVVLPPIRTLAPPLLSTPLSHCTLSQPPPSTLQQGIGCVGLDNSPTYLMKNNQQRDEFPSAVESLC